MADGRHDGWNAQQFRLTDEERQTDALVGGFVATRAHTAGDPFAALLAASRNAHLRLLARIAGRADIGNADAAGERVSVVALEAGAGGSLAARSDALGVLAAEDAFAERDAGAGRALLEAG